MIEPMGTSWMPPVAMNSPSKAHPVASVSSTLVTTFAQFFLRSSPTRGTSTATSLGGSMAAAYRQGVSNSSSTHTPGETRPTSLGRHVTSAFNRITTILASRHDHADSAPEEKIT